MKTRRWLALVLTICLVLSLSASALAAELSMSADKTTLQTGETVTLTLTVSESLTGTMDGVGVHFNGNLFELTDTRLENPFELGALQTDKDGTRYYTVSFMSYDGSVTVAAGAFARLTFRALRTVHSEELGSFYFTEDGWMDDEFEPISMTITTGGKTSPITVTVTHVHSYNAGVVTTPADCTTEGVKTYTCSLCGDIYTEAIAARGHTEVTDEAIPAGCTEGGLTEGKHCSVCGEVLVPQAEVPANGHQYQNGACTVCGHVLMGDVVMDGVLNIKDVSALFRVITAAESTANGDVNGDGRVSIKDVYALFRMLAS